MTYVFESKSGRQVERDYPMGSAPQSVTVDGERFRRIIAGVGIIGQPLPATESESKMLLRHKKRIEANADAVRDGRLTITDGKHCDAAHKPRIPKKIY